MSTRCRPATMADRLADGSPGPFGTFHAVGGEPLSWVRFAEAIFASAARQGLQPPRLRPTTTDAYPGAAARPRVSLPDCSALARGCEHSVPAPTALLDRT